MTSSMLLETDPVQRLAREDIEEDFDLVRPACRGGREVKLHVRVRGEPLVTALVR